MVGSQDTALLRSACKRLELVHQQLEIVQSELIVATVALRSLGVEHDQEFARELEYGARGRSVDQQAQESVKSRLRSVKSRTANNCVHAAVIRTHATHFIRYNFLSPTLDLEMLL